jgi:hypothetical protein
MKFFAFRRIASTIIGVDSTHREVNIDESSAVVEVGLEYKRQIRHRFVEQAFGLKSFTSKSSHQGIHAFLGQSENTCSLSRASGVQIAGGGHPYVRWASTTRSDERRRPRGKRGSKHGLDRKA